MCNLYFYKVKVLSRLLKNYLNILPQLALVTMGIYEGEMLKGQIEEVVMFFQN